MKKADWKWLEVSAATASMAANIVVILSLPIALFTFYSQQEQSRREATFQMVMRLNDGALLEAQRFISGEIARLPLAQLDDELVKRSTVATLVSQVAETSDNPRHFQHSVVLVVSFFDEAQACVELNSCSGQDMSFHIGEAARRYACLLLPYTFELRNSLLYDGLGDGLSRMARYEESC